MQKDKLIDGNTVLKTVEELETGQKLQTEFYAKYHSH